MATSQKYSNYSIGAHNPAWLTPKHAIKFHFRQHGVCKNPLWLIYIRFFSAEVGMLAKPFPFLAHFFPGTSKGRIGSMYPSTANIHVFTDYLVFKQYSYNQNHIYTIIIFGRMHCFSLAHAEFLQGWTTCANTNTLFDLREAQAKQLRRNGHCIPRYCVPLL